jgi:hypothetical protein
LGRLPQSSGEEADNQRALVAPASPSDPLKLKKVLAG